MAAAAYALTTATHALTVDERRRDRAVHEEDEDPKPNFEKP